jgi:hypothetical protein
LSGLVLRATPNKRIPSLAKRGRCYVGLAKSGILR